MEENIMSSMFACKTMDDDYNNNNNFVTHFLELQQAKNY